MAALRFRFRRGLPAEWTTANPVLAEGEPGVELRLGGADMMKVGDGATPWVDLPYVVGTEGPSGFVVEQGGVYPSRPIAGPVVFIGPDNPDDLGLMLVGDTWIDSDGDEDPPAYILSSEKGAASGVATLDTAGKVPAGQLPSYVDDVLEYATLAAFPATGAAGTIYVALNNGKTYRWSGSAYVEISPSDVNSVAGKTGIVTLVAGDVGAHPAGGLLTDGMLPTRIRSGAHNVTDWDTAIENGWYTGAAAAVNGPEDAGIGAPVATYAGLVVRYSATYVRQTVYAVAVPAATNTRTYQRDLVNGVWGTWYRVHDSEGELDARYAQIANTVLLTGAQTIAGAKTFSDRPVFSQGATVTGGTNVHLGAVGSAAPTFTTRSAGAKVVLYDNLTASAADYALGIESNTLWSGVPTTGNQFKWYGGTTLAATLTGLGNLTTTGTITAGGTGFAGPGANITGISGSNVTSWNGVTTSNLWVRAQNDIVVWSGPATNDTAGELVLQTNVKTVNKMVLIRFRGQSHTTRNVIDCVVRGYWTGTAGANTFLTTAVINYGNHRIASVRALRRISDDTLALALTPDPVAVGWDFAKMSVDAQVAYGGDQADILTGWSLNILTDTSAYAEIVNINPQNVAFTSEPDSLTVTGGAITLNNATSNLVNFGTAGLAAPAFTTRSAGTKLVIYNSVAADAVDYGIGVETGHMWFSASQAVGTRGFKWYGGTTSLATLTGTGNLTVTGTVTAGGTGFAGPGVNITTLNATNLTAGTVPDAALPARLRVETSLLTDANSATANGWYRIPITGTNIPDATSGWLIQAQANDTGALYVTQVAHGFSLDSSADTRTYRRELNNGTWGSWYRIWQSEVELDARYKNVGEAVTDAELPARLKATHNSDVPSGDWNMALDTGWYAHSFAANAPESSTAWHMGMVLAHNVGWVTQTVHRFTSDSSTNTETFQRDLNNGTWGAWYRLRLSEAELDARYARGEDSGWVAPTLSNGWVNYGSPYATAAYRKIGNRVTIKGLIKSGTVTSGTTVFTLPVGYRPTEILHLPIYANGAFAGVHLNTNGAVQADSGWQATWTSLSGISFLVD